SGPTTPPSAGALPQIAIPPVPGASGVADLRSPASAPAAVNPEYRYAYEPPVAYAAPAVPPPAGAIDSITRGILAIRRSTEDALKLDYADYVGYKETIEKYRQTPPTSYVGQRDFEAAQDAAMVLEKKW